MIRKLSPADERPKPALTVHSSARSTDSRGRGAKARRDLCWREWRDIFLHVFHGISADRISGEIALKFDGEPERQSVVRVILPLCYGRCDGLDFAQRRL
jgi:hypothetical protein